MIMEANPHGLNLTTTRAGFHPCFKIKPLQSYFKPTARMDLKVSSPFLFSSRFFVLPGMRHDGHHHLVSWPLKKSHVPQHLHDGCWSPWVDHWYRPLLCHFPLSPCPLKKGFFLSWAFLTRGSAGSSVDFFLTCWLSKRSGFVHTRGHVERESTSVLLKSRSDARGFSENVEGRIDVIVPLV
jgi:hypothetical protein